MHLECLDVILDKNIEINAQNNDGETALTYSCKLSKENEEIILLFLKNNFDTNIKTNIGRTAFLEACESGNGEVVKHLLYAGADINHCDEKKLTGAHEAAKNGHLDVLFVLAAFGFDFNVLDNEGNNPLHYAAKSNPMCCKFLGQRNCDAKLKNEQDKMPRNIALDESQKACAKELRKLERVGSKVSLKRLTNAEPWAIRLYDWTVVHSQQLHDSFLNLSENAAALEEANAEIGLNEHGDDLENQMDVEKNANLQTSHDQELATAMRSDNTDDNQKAASRSRSSSKKRNKKSRSRSRKRTSKKLNMRLAVDDVEQLLQSFQAPINSEIMKKLTTLHQKDQDATIDWQEFLTGKKYVNKAYLKTAYEEKKKKKKKGKKGGKKRKNPLDICVVPEEAIFRRADGGPPTMYIPKQIPFTDSNRFNPDNPPDHPLQDDSFWYLDPPKRQYVSFHGAAIHNDLSSIYLAISEGYSVDTRDRFYKTPLMVAAHYGNLEAAVELIKLGADVNARDNFKWTPLHHAAHSGLVDVVELMLNNGAQLEAKALNGSTPLFRAIECSKLNVVEYLISKGAKLTVETRKGENPYKVALNWSDPRVVEHVHDKWELVQETNDKKKQGSAAKRKSAKSTTSTSKKRPNSALSLLSAQPNNLHRTYSFSNFMQHNINLDLHQFRSLDIARRLHDIRICPRFFNSFNIINNHLLLTWSKRASHLQLERERFGWDHGLPDVNKCQFSKHLAWLFSQIETD